MASEPPATSGSWSTPTNASIKRVSAIPAGQHEFNFLNNLDCQVITYRLVSSSEMKSGCFTSTAFGLMDADSRVVIFTGTDEGLPITPAANGHILTPWPNAGTLIVLDPVNTGGTRLSLYSGPTSVMQDERNILLQLTGKKLKTSPDIKLFDNNNNPLIINPQTLAVSDGGSWLVAETLYGSFVRINLASLSVKHFAPAYVPGGLPSRVAVSDDGRFVAVYNKNMGHLKVYDLNSCNESICASFNYQTTLNQQVDSIKSLRHIRFVNKNLLSIEVTATDSNKTGAYHISPDGVSTAMTDYIALGDSYTSGEGAFDYRDGTDTSNNHCHQSIHSYPSLLTKDIFSSIGGHSVACSGARIRDVGSTSSRYRGQMKGVVSQGELELDQPDLLESVETNYLPGYIAQHRFVKRWQPQVVTVSIGGNDIGFGDILHQCVIPKLTKNHSDNVCFSTYESRTEVFNLIRKTIPRLTSLYKQLKTESPNTQIYVIGYPDVIDDTGKCALNVNLAKSELEFAKEVVVHLNNGVREAADEANVSYVDISQALVGHRLCEAKSSSVAVNGLTAGRDNIVFGGESYHPNMLGHQLIEQEILRKTSNFTLANPPSEPSQPKDISNLPRSGEPLVNRQPSNFTNTVVYRSNSANISVKESTLKPNSNYTIRIGGVNGQVIAGGVSGNDGSIEAIINIPSDIEPRSTTIDIVGENPVDELTDIVQPIYIPENPEDFDGDGLPTEHDSCPFVINSGQDTDKDGIDDICDPSIGDPPTNTSEQPNDQGSSESDTAGTGAILDNPVGSGQIITTLNGPEVTGITLQRQQQIVSTFKATSRVIATKHNGLLTPTNTAGNFQKKPDSNAELVAYKNPAVWWWVYLLFMPLVLWLCLKIGKVTQIIWLKLLHRK